MRLMNYDPHSGNEDYWRMKVWNKSLSLEDSWPTVCTETIREIRYVSKRYSLKLPITFNKLTDSQIQKLSHDNVTPLVHAIIEPFRLCLITEYQDLGSLLVCYSIQYFFGSIILYFLQDILSKEDTCLDFKLVTSLSLNLVNGMIYLHDSQLGFHGNLKSSNCLIDSNWTLKITNFGLKHIRNARKPFGMTERDYFSEHYASPFPP